MKETFHLLFAAACLLCVGCDQLGRQAFVEGEAGPLTWTFVRADSTLMIRGDGAMPDNWWPSWGQNPPPWFFAQNGKDEVTYIKKVVIDQGVTSIGNQAFWNCVNLEEVSIPVSVTSIGGGAFWHCSNLRAITLPESLTELGMEAFAFCGNLSAITIPARVGSIESGTFGYCDNLSNVMIGEGVTNIGLSAFIFCKNLISIAIPDNVATISPAAFAVCDSLSSIEVSTGNRHYSSVEGVLFNRDRTTLVLYPPGRQNAHYDIPDGVISIAQGALGDCPHLKSATLPSSLTRIEPYAFHPNLTTLLSMAPIPPKLESSINGYFPNPNDILRVPSHSTEAYKADTLWHTAFGQIAEW